VLRTADENISALSIPHTKTTVGAQRFALKGKISCKGATLCAQKQEGKSANIYKCKNIKGDTQSKSPEGAQSHIEG